VLPVNLEAESCAAEALQYLSEEMVAYYPAHESIPYEFSGHTSDIVAARIRVLNRILSGERLLIFTSVAALMQRLPSPERSRKATIRFETGSIFEPTKLSTELVDLGYRRTERVEAPGEFSFKGSILDIFSPGQDVPVRVDFFDEEVESIRIFNPDNQKSGEIIPSTLVSPSGEIVLTSEEAIRLLAILDKKFPGRHRPLWLDDLASHTGEKDRNLSSGHLPGLEELYPLVCDTSTLLDYFISKPSIWVHPLSAVRETREVVLREYRTLYERESSEKVCLAPDLLLATGEGIFSGAELLEESGQPTAEATERESYLFVSSPENFQGRLSDIRTKARTFVEEGGSICISSPFPAQIHRIAGIFRGEKGLRFVVDEHSETVPDDVLEKPGIYLIKASQRKGFHLPEIQFQFWTDADIFGKSYKRRSRFKKSGSSPIDSFLDLKEGDFIVHVNHGIGRFLMIERIKAAGRERDFLVVEYADEDRLYVPLDQISLVQKYIAPVEKPKLDSLGRSSFKKIKERVEKRIEELAQDLIKIYAARMSQQGYSFPGDTAWQDEFEAEFEYEETPDQIQAIEAVKRDMESPRPMDRLICGDVGYGKTEVAIRAAFKAVMAGKQVILIAPTTILALQHYRNFSERFKDYPIRVDWLSRFRTRGEMNSVRKDILEGEVDVVIGTHALFSKDMRMKNLGLLIVDEEQRFGVVHKEAIKSMKKLVDVLTLSATPIPRTLHMSLVGIRDLSIIQTPPKDRLPVQTYVVEDSDSIIEEAIKREIARGGQVFYLHNRVESIELTARRIGDLLPGVSMTVLHGQMPEDVIEDTLVDFVKGKYEVLVTTTIIESGIDMPHVNTLIIDRADTFGLSQLYQIRGRVGRSNKQAYAYLLCPRGRVLSEQAQKRLNTIMEYQDLGSGFKVAMRDLEIRGAGNILGSEQSGDIMDVGFELYVKLLEEAVHKLKGEKIEIDVRTVINLNTDFYIPEDYIPFTRQRIEFYKRYEACHTDEEVESLFQEMVDRFGVAPPIALVFAKIEKIRALASLAGFASVYQEDSGRVLFRAGEHFRVPPAQVIATLKKHRAFSVQPGSSDTLYFDHPGNFEERLDEMIFLLQELTLPLKKSDDDSIVLEKAPARN